ncbi:replication-relaxation family protein [Streptomyces sp. NPDC006385]|uniref:replication-relaxation family protein n=1 Tax=Streptomyces sp. NPDC006385 TaxID=3156761 RepID=UPI00339F20CB
MAVNETVIALLRPKPDLARLEGAPAEALEEARAAVQAPGGLGTIASYATEVPLPMTGTWNAPGKGGALPDIALTAPEAGVPLLFVEVDNCHESAQVLADKVDKYGEVLPAEGQGSHAGARRGRRCAMRSRSTRSA